MARLTRLQAMLNVCPSDLTVRSELALLLERLEQHEEALLQWRAILSSDTNSLIAREGVARCREHLGRPLPSRL